MSDFALVIVSNVVVASCVAVVAVVIGLRSRFCQTAHVLWLLFFVKLIAPPIVALPLPLPARLYDRFIAQTVAIPAAVSTETEPETNGQNPTASGLQNLQKTAHSAAESEFLNYGNWLLLIVTWEVMGWGLFVVWIIVAFYLLGRGANRFVRFALLIRDQAITDQSAGDEAQRLYELIRRPTGPRQRRIFPARRLPQIFVVPSDMAPMLFGIGPWIAIVCPQRLWNQFGIERQRAFIAHELAHFLRLDHWMRWLEWVVSSIYWWLPLTYFARSQLERSEELACDEWAINRFSIKRRDYAETLLQVVEFLDESQLRSQRLASRMQPTDLLEQRMHWVLSTGPTVPRLRCWSCLSLGVALALLLLHPLPYRSTHARSDVASPSPISLAEPRVGNVAGMAEGAADDEDRRLPAASLGWWNKIPEGPWAEVVFKSTGARLIAGSDLRLKLWLADGRRHTFHPGEVCISEAVNTPLQPFAKGNSLTACAEIPDARRLVLGDADGALRLWDLGDLLPVSLIGTHSAGITSIAFHDRAGLVAADSLGSVIRWDHNSGSAVSTWTSEECSIQSIRWSRSGEHLGVLLGSWSHDAKRRQFVMLDALNFETSIRIDLPAETALVWDDAHLGWLYASWLGHIYLLSGQPVTAISKSEVSAMVLTQDAIRPIAVAIAHGELLY